MTALAEALRMLPLLARLVKAIRGSGRDPRETIEGLASSYEIRRDVDRRVDRMIDDRFG